MVSTLLVLIVPSTAFSDDPPRIQRDGPPRTYRTMVPSAVIQQPANNPSTVPENGSTEVNARSVETMAADGAITVLLSDKATIKHSSKTNGAFSLSAKRIRLSSSSDVVRDRTVSSLTGFDATGSCVFISASIKVSADRVVLKSLLNHSPSSISFEGNVSFLTGKIIGWADSITLTRTDDAWELSCLLAEPKNGR
jgi:hypothetical protein